jgi:flagellin-like protein
LDGGVKKKMMITKMRRNVKALSPIFAVLILIAIAVIAGIVVYMFTSGTIATMTGGGTAGQEKVAIEAVETTTSGITAWAKSTGGGAVEIDSAIVKDSAGNVVVVDNTVSVTLPAAGTLTQVPATVTLTSGEVYTVTLTSKGGGSFVSSSFKAP